MTDPRAITADAMEILVVRELRKAGIEPVGLQRQWLDRLKMHSSEFAFDLRGRLQAYERKWTVLVECRNTAGPIQAADVSALRIRADTNRIASAVFCTTGALSAEVRACARELRMPLLRVVDAAAAYAAAGMIDPGPLPAWVPEYTVELVTLDRTTLLVPNEPEVVLEQMR